MKSLKLVSGLLVLLCFPVLLHAQVIRVSGSANIIVSGDAKVVLHDGNLVQGTLASNATPVVFDGYYDNTSLQPSKNLPVAVATNVLIDKSYGSTLTSNDNTYIFLGQALSFKKPSGIQPFMQAWPNPTTERITLTVNSDKATTGTIVLQDETGRILERRRVYYNSAGVTTIQWDLSRYTTGSYLLVFENAPGKYLKIVKQ